MLEQEAKALRADIRQRQKARDGAEEVINAKVIHVQMANAEEINSKIRENRLYTEVDQKLCGLRKQSKSLSDQMMRITDFKAETLAKAKFPINGLAIGGDDDGGVTFEGIPLSQCSSSQQIKISVAIGLAMNPKLRVLLIREGSLLDEKNLAMIAKMAADADSQVWVERVSKGKECTVIIEDGSVKELEVSHVSS